MRSRPIPRCVSVACWLASSVFAFSVSVGRVARADLPSIDIRQFRPPADPAGSLYLEPAATPGTNNYNLGAWFSYVYRPAVVRDASGNILGNIISHQVISDFVANIGVSPRASFGLVLPVLLYQTGDHTQVIDQSTGRPPEQALGDVGLVLKGYLVPQGPMGGFGLSVLGRFTFPTGSTSSYLGEGTPVTELRLLGEYRLIAFSLQATGGFSVRSKERDVFSRTYGNEIPWGVALSVRPQAFGWDDRGHWTWTAELHGSALLAPSEDAESKGQSTPVSPVVMGVSARYALGASDVSLLGGVQTALTKALGGAPFSAIASVQWAPRVHDADHDGVPDDADECPELAEDRDGFEDSDGCPDLDNDDDGVPDKDDKCPLKKEDVDGFQDEDGCPDPDNDKDGILDEQDACPNEAGPASADPKRNGCPDRDGDGIVDSKDKCPDVPEDKDGFEDEDGCPDPDNDKDDIPDTTDACPNEAGPSSSNPKYHGCPRVDRDGDGLDDADDKCPAEAEIYNGIDDEDGCPDEGGRPLVTAREGKAGWTVQIAAPIQFGASQEVPVIRDASRPVLRALAQELNRHPGWVLGVGVRPSNKTDGAQRLATEQQRIVVEALRAITHRQQAAAPSEWKLVEKQPNASTTGLGFIVLMPPETGSAKDR